MKRRSALWALGIFLAILLMAAAPYPPESHFFRDMKKARPEVTSPASVPEILRFDPSEDQVLPFYYTHPLKKVNGQWAMAYRDLLHLVGKKRISYLPDKGIITINQIDRIYMAVDRAAVIGQSGSTEARAYPTLVDDVLYVPLFFCLEHMGYTTNLTDDGSGLLIVPPPEKVKVVPDRAVKVGSIRPYRDGTMDTAVFDMNGTELWGWGEKVPRGMGSLFHLNEKQTMDFVGDLALESPQDYDENSKSALATDGHRIYIYPLDKGSRQILTMPYAMRGAKRFCYDEGGIYFQRADGIDVFYPKTKTLKRVVDRAVEDFDVQGGRVLFKADGQLFLQDKDGPPRNIEAKSGVSFKLSDSYIVLDDGELGLVSILSADDLKVLCSLAYDAGKNHSVKLMNDRYLALGQGNTLKLKDLDSGTHRVLDMVNIEDTLRGRRVLWLYNGNIVKGYVYGDGVKIAQCVTIRP